MYSKSATNLSKLSVDKVKQFLNSFDVVLTDCDGVLWFENEAIPRSADVINALRSLGKKIVYVTNNSTKCRDEYVAKCDKLNFTCTKDEVVSTAYLAANYLKNIGFNKKVYLVGQSGMEDELDFVGIQHFGAGPDVLDRTRTDTLGKIHLDPEVGAVLVGYDEHISLTKIIKAASYLKDPNCLFVATNIDQRFAYGKDLIIPGAGCMLAAIQTCAQREPVMMGKPSDYLSKFLISHYKIDPKRTIMIGDNSKTDILLGTRCGFQTLLVLSGVTCIADVAEWQKSNSKEHQALIPDVYLEKLGDLLEFLN